MKTAVLFLAALAALAASAPVAEEACVTCRTAPEPARGPDCTTC